jgi:hypothetical protein
MPADAPMTQVVTPRNIRFALGSQPTIRSKVLYISLIQVKEPIGVLECWLDPNRYEARSRGTQAKSVQATSVITPVVMW